MTEHTGEHPGAADVEPMPSPSRSPGRAPVADRGAGSDELHPLRRVIRLLAHVAFVYVMIVEVILVVGFVCLLFGIEPGSWFVDLVYRSVEPTMQPFAWLFTEIEFGTGASSEVRPRIESAMVFAMIVYGIVALAAHDLAQWVGRPPQSEPGEWSPDR